MKNLVIIGAGAFARELFYHAQGSLGYGKTWRVKGFIDGNVPIGEEEGRLLPMPILGDVFSYAPAADDVFACAVGTPEPRRKLVEIMRDKGANFLTLIHNTVIVQERAKIGQGAILCPYVTVNDLAVVGDFAFINMKSTLGHDAEIGEYSCVMAQVFFGGGAKVGKGTFFGSGANILPHAKVEDGAFVGAGSVVLKRVRANTKVFGNPAMVID